MKSNVIAVSSQGDQVTAALKEAEKVADYVGLPLKDALHLRLLTEETIRMINSIAGAVTGEFWIEVEKQVCRLHLQVETDLNTKQRDQLISVSSSGKNEAGKGIMGLIRSFFDPVDEIPMFFDVGLERNLSSEISWSMREYQDQLLQYVSQNRQGALDAWDELEKSVICHVADDVKVSIRGRNVEMVVLKAIACP